MSATLIGLTALIYCGVAISELLEGHHGMALVFFAYALANIGLILSLEN
jgi:hypothetical protein